MARKVHETKAPRLRSGRRTGDARRPAPDPFARLQSLLGNRSTGRLVQARLAIGSPGDRLEREADRMADDALQGREQGLFHAAAEDRSAPGAPGRPLVPSVGTPTELLGGLGPGRRLDASVRGFFEPRFDRDLGQVRVHDGPRAAAAADRLGARAFTVGSHIAFGEGRYRPTSGDGKRLLAHELAHTVQQSGWPASAAVPLLQLAPIPNAAPLAAFERWTQRAIDDLRPGSTATLGQEALVILKGLRNHVTLRDVAGNQVRPGGRFNLTAGTLFTGLPGSVPFELVVDDRAAPTLRGIHRPPTSPGDPAVITVFADKFRGEDHQTLGTTLYHEAVHALFYLRRAYPAVRLRGLAARILTPRRVQGFAAGITMSLTMMLQGDSRTASVARRLAEEILVMAETTAHEASITGTRGAAMNERSFKAQLSRYLFRGGHLLTPVDRNTILADLLRRQGLVDLLDQLYRFYNLEHFRRLGGVGVSPSGVQVRGAPPSSIWSPSSRRRPLVPEVIRSIRNKPF